MRTSNTDDDFHDAAMYYTQTHIKIVALITLLDNYLTYFGEKS